MRPCLALAFLVAALPAAPQSPSVLLHELDEKVIHYSSSDLSDPVAKLRDRIEKGEVTLEYRDKRGYLDSILAAMNLPVSSQSVVFSKTSIQMAKIFPSKPRALYFSDDVYVGWVQGGLIEFASVDPQKGAVFYTLENKKTDKPKIHRGVAECLNCHINEGTLMVPGFIARSVYPDNEGEPILRGGTYQTDHRSPLSERFGGWYVTGEHGSERHMGNSVVHSSNPEKMDREKGANLTSLNGKVNMSPYPSPYSDIVALMVLDHQVRFHNLVTRVNYVARLGGAPGSGPAPDLKRDVDQLVRYMVFGEEAALKSPVKGPTSFREDFEARGPKDHQGRSLRQMDMQTHMFRYPLSYLIYSESFDALPDNAKDMVYRKLYDVLTGKEQSAPYANIPLESKRAALEVLVETKQNLPAYFRTGTLPSTGQ